MSVETPFVPPMPDTIFLPSALAWQSACCNMALQAQQMQLQILSDWQNATNEFHKELWDSWIARFGGGVPIDA